jgi:chromosome segregation protein
MARSKGYSEQDVIVAVAELTEKGRSINGSSLRSVIGTGRPANIFATYEKLLEEGALDKYRQLPVEEEQEKEYELPPEILDAREIVLSDMSVIFTRINNLANSIAEKRLNAAVLQAKEMARVSSERLASAEEEMNQAYNTIEDQKDLLDSAEIQAAGYLEKINQLEKDLALSNNRNDSLEVDNGRLKFEVDELKRSKKTLEIENSEQFTKITQLSSQIDGLNAAAKEQSLKLTDLETSRVKQEEAISELGKELELANKDKIESESQSKANLRLLNDAKAQLSEVKAELKQVRTEHSSATEKNGELTGQLLTLKTNYERSVAENKSVEEELQKALTYKTSIGNENARLREIQSSLSEELKDLKQRNLVLERENAKLS